MRIKPEIRRVTALHDDCTELIISNQKHPDTKALERVIEVLMCEATYNDGCCPNAIETTAPGVEGFSWCDWNQDDEDCSGNAKDCWLRWAREKANDE